MRHEKKALSRPCDRPPTLYSIQTISNATKRRGKENINIDICYALVGYPPDNYEQIECYDLISQFEQIINRLPTPLRTPNTMTYK